MATRTFRTKHIYHVQSTHLTKGKATKEARWLRKQGNKARVVKSGKKYKVYTYRPS